MIKTDFKNVEYLIDNHPIDKIGVSYSGDDKYEKLDNSKQSFYIEALPRKSSIDLFVFKIEKVPFINILNANKEIYINCIDIMVFISLVFFYFTNPSTALISGIFYIIISAFIRSRIADSQLYREANKYPTFKNNYKITYYIFPEIIKLYSHTKENEKIIRSKAFEEAITSPFTSFPTMEIVKKLNNYKSCVDEKDYNHTVISEAEKALYDTIIRYEVKELNRLSREKAKELEDKKLLEEKHKNKLIEEENELLNSIHVAETIQSKNNNAFYLENT